MDSATDPMSLPVPVLPDTILDRLHDRVARSGGRYEEWRIGARPADPAYPPWSGFAERVDSPAVAHIVVDHLSRLGAQKAGTVRPDADEVYAYHAGVCAD